MCSYKGRFLCPNGKIHDILSGRWLPGVVRFERRFEVGFYIEVEGCWFGDCVRRVVHTRDLLCAG